MIGWIAARLMGLGLGEKFARPVAWAAIALAAAALVVVAIALRDRRMIEQHDAGQTIAIERAAREADRTVATQRRDDDARLAAEKSALEKVITDAPAAPPVDARRAYYRCVRLQQAARAAGNPAPAC